MIVKNYESAKDFVKKNGDGDILVSDKFIDSKTDMIFRCHICNETYAASWNEYQQGHRHNKCMSKINGLNKRHSYEYVKEKIESFGCDLLSLEYHSSKEKLDIKFLCGHEGKRSYAYFINSPKKCTQCISKDLGRVPRGSWNVESMNKYCVDNNIRYTVLDTKWISLSYQKQLWALVKCPNEKHLEYWVWWNNFTKGYFCKSCWEEEKNIIFWDLNKIKDFYFNHNLEILDITEWEDVDTDIYCLNKDGYKVKTSISDLRAFEKIGKGYGPNLFRNNKYAIDNIKLFCEKERPDYELLSEKYTFIKDYYLFKYNGIGLPEDVDKKFYTTLDCFFHGKVLHPYLHKTKAELEIENFLISNNIFYKFQYTDHKCKNPNTGWKLRFDFGIFENDGSLKMIIESDGTSHDTVIEWWGGENQLLDLQKRDEIKNEYCKNNNIPLLRIPHTQDKNISQILTQELNLQRKEAEFID